MKTLTKALALSVGLTQLLCLSAPVLADNSQIPKYLYGWRDDLLRNRDALLSEKAAANGDIQEYKDGIVEIEKGLPTCNPSAQTELLAIRARWLNRIKELESYIGTCEALVIKTDKALSGVESDMQAWACLK